MAVALQAWLRDEIATQLALAHSWLQTKHASQAAPDRRLDDIYADNGSSLAIAGPVSAAGAQVLLGALLRYDAYLKAQAQRS